MSTSTPKPPPTATDLLASADALLAELKDNTAA